MRVLLLNPPWGRDFCRSARWAARSRGRVQRHPDWMLIAAACLEREGHEVTFHDGAALNSSPAGVRAVMEAARPRLTVVHTTTPSIANDLEYAKLAKSLGSLAVAVGPHVSAEPEDTCRRAPFLDAVALGEYDATLCELAAERPPEQVPGLALPAAGGAFRTGAREPLDVRTLPFPAWRHVRPEWYRDAGKRFPFLTLISGRGCPNRCTFCRDTPVMYGRALRLRDPEQVVEEMAHDRRLFPQLREIMVETDTFTASPAHARGVCEELLRRGRRTVWSCNVRVDLDPDLLPLMRRAGCRMLMVGFEFGTQGALDAVRKGITVEQSERFARAADRLGFTLHGCFMIGAPGETEESARATIRLATRLPLDTIQVSGICAYPGTELYRWAREGGHLVPRHWEEWVGPDREQVTLLDYPQLPKARIDALIDEGLREFYLRPRQMLRMAFRIRSAGDLARKLYGLGSFLDYFSGRRRPA